MSNSGTGLAGGRRDTLRLFFAAAGVGMTGSSPPEPRIRSQSSGEIKISRAWEPAYGPTIPSSAMKSISRAARP